MAEEALCPTPLQERMYIMRRLISFMLCLILLFSLSACGRPDLPVKEDPSAGTENVTPSTPSTPAADEKEPTSGQTPEAGTPSDQPQEPVNPSTGEPGTAEPTVPQQPEPPVTPAVEPYEILDPTVMPEGGERNGVKYKAYKGVVEHLFFHPVIAYPEQAFDGDSMSNGYDDWMVTVDEYNKILQSVYDKGYVLVDIADCWSETVDANGNARMVKNTLYLPEGKKPLIISYDDVNYNYYTLGDGFTYKLILGEDGKLWSWGLDPAGKEVVSRDLDAITILDKFVEEHPDFSPFGAKGCLSLTGYEGILGYRTHTDKDNWNDAKEANRQKEIEAVKPIVAELKRTGWTFGSHTFGHIRLSEKSLSSVQADMTRWLNEVGSLVGEVSVLFYPFGARLDGDDVNQSGPAMQWMIEQGFRIFCSVGIESYSKIKKDACAVICDRLHPDGTTLRTNSGRNRYMKFYDAKDIIDLDARPVRDVGWLTPVETVTPAAPVAPVAPDVPATPANPAESTAPAVPENAVIEQVILPGTDNPAAADPSVPVPVEPTPAPVAPTPAPEGVNA